MLERKKFQRRIEDFTCENCGVVVKGSGYTDHCPSCLYGKHVDVNPGDRAADCGGLMEPVDIEVSGNSYTIVYKCVECGHTFRVKAAKGDSIDRIIEISKKL